MSDIYGELKQMKATIEAKIKHPYLMEFIEKPLIDEDKMLLLYEILKEAKTSIASMKDYIIPTMLVQVALDTHELVTTTKLEEEDERMKSRQLTVLAGDYYSGLYYYLLAKVGNLTMISNLAHAIREINEHKISVYQKDTGCVENLMNSIRQIESSLIQKMADLLQVPNMKELAANLCFYKRLQNERDKFLSNRFSLLFDAIKKEVISGGVTPERGMDDQRDHLLNICDYYMKQAKQQIELQLAQHFTFSEVLRKRIDGLLFDYPYMNDKVVEEG
ncbi:heptaprenyl diphosphate synthase component 1 [Bacillus tianshenii]|nr:heptaprenyl diphosphate synthase component 1 [Bacillus tianshenii]